MRTRSISEKIVFSLSVIGLGLSVMGTDRCTEDYSVAGQLAISTSSATTTPAPTETDDGGDDELITRTPTFTPTSTPGVFTPLATVTPTITRTPRATAVVLDPLTSSLADLATKTAEQTKTSSANTGAVAAGASANGNWLGKGFDKDGSDSSAARDAVDSDDDGYADWAEERFGSDPEDGNSIPGIPPASRLSDRLDSLGAPITVDAIRNDMATARQRKLHDSDGDTVPDDDELAIGSDPLSQDSDLDGIWDGREIELGTDPVKPEWQ